MDFLLELMLLVATLSFIAWPLVSKRAVATDALTDTELSGLLYRKDIAFSALKDLKFDYETGKLDDHDYEEMKERFESEAIGVMRKIDECEDDTVQTTTETAAVVDTSSKSAPTKFCHQCGTKIGDDHKFCSSCGHKF